MHARMHTRAHTHTHTESVAKPRWGTLGHMHYQLSLAPHRDNKSSKIAILPHFKQKINYILTYLSHT